MEKEVYLVLHVFLVRYQRYLNWIICVLYDRNNIFAKIIRGELPCKKVHEDENLIAFHDINPVAPVHILVAPKKDCINYTDFINSTTAEDVSHFFTKVNQIALAHTGDFRLVTNCGVESGQTVFHFHIHIIGGSKLKDI